MLKRLNLEEKIVGTGCLLWFAFLIASLAGWVTHVITCIQNENWLFLIAGAIAAPIGVIHGWGLWFGFF